MTVYVGQLDNSWLNTGCGNTFFPSQLALLTLHLATTAAGTLTLLVVGDEGLGEGLPDGVDLGGVSAALDADPDVHVGEAVLAEEQEGLLELVLQGLGLNLVQGTPVHLDEAAPALAVSHGGGGFLKF